VRCSVKVSVFDVEALLRPYYDALVSDVGDLSLYDAHTHVGFNDPDGFKQDASDLIGVLETVDARGVVFPMHEPDDGYTAANDHVIEAAANSGGRLVSFCRLNPHSGSAVEEARRALDAGAVGIKLHPRAEQFTLHTPGVRDIIALAHERELPVLIHAGRGIPALGQDTVKLSEEFRGARLILAHCAISDLAWLWRLLPDHPNVFLDTAWWAPSDLIATFTLCPPQNVVWASDSPYGLPIAAAFMAFRCALQAGLTAEQVHGIAGAQLERVLAGAEPLDLGPPPGEAVALDPLLERVITHLTSAMGRAFGQADPSESVALARLACAVGDEHPHADVFAAVLELLDLYEENLAPPPPGRRFPISGRFLLAALNVARTPDVPLPPRPSAPHPTREAAER
jgi:predicted TIM-barrel fold metal-dependent hydrolase